MSSTAARTTDLEVGILHAPLTIRGVICRGALFTVKAIMHANQRKILNQELGIVWAQYWIITKFNEPIIFWIYTRATRSGRDHTSA